MSKRRRPFVPPPECPVCGAVVPSKARACPQCGADERTGWNEEDTRYDGLDLPASAFEDDEEATDCDQAVSGRSAARGFSFFWWGTGLCIIFLITYLVLAGRF